MDAIASTPDRYFAADVDADFERERLRLLGQLTPNSRPLQVARRRRRAGAIERIGTERPALARPFENAIHTGTFCRYQPDRPLRWGPVSGLSPAKVP